MNLVMVGSGICKDHGRVIPGWDGCCPYCGGEITDVTVEVVR